jgi:hypothetical protein
MGADTTGCQCELRDRKAGKKYKFCKKCEIASARVHLAFFSSLLIPFSYALMMLYFEPKNPLWIIPIIVFCWIPRIVMLFFGSRKFFDCELRPYRSRPPARSCEYCQEYRIRASRKVFWTAIGCRHFFDEYLK